MPCGEGLGLGRKVEAPEAAFMHIEGLMKNFRFRMAGLLLMAVFLPACTWMDRPDVEDPVETDPDKFAPLTLKTLNGETRSVSHFLGKATLVNFFFPT